MSTPWCKIPGLMRWWWSGTEDKKYRTAASPVVFTLLAVLLAGPLLTGYPAVWISTYFYNYYSVIYPKDIPQDKEKVGMAITNTMIKIGDGMLNNWQDNDLPISSSKTPYIGVDNPQNFQIGELMMYRRVLEEMREHLSRRTTNDYIDTNITDAYNQFAYTSNKWWLRSTESMYKDGVDDLKIFLKKVENKDAGFYATTYNLDKLLEKVASGLAGTSRRLEDARKTKVPWIIDFKVDDNYYEAQGNLYVTLQVLRAARIDFQNVLTSKQASLQMDDMIQSIERSDSYLVDPILVLNGQPGSFIPFHSGELASLMQTVSRNIDKLRSQITS